ncbi:MAG: hypothetical protein ACRCTZ_14960 [Sarcina sp.]
MVRISVKTTISLNSLMECFKNMEDVHNKEKILMAGQVILKKYSVPVTMKEVKETKKILHSCFTHKYENPDEVLFKIIYENADIEKKYKDKYFAAYMYLEFLNNKCTSFLKKDDKEYKMVNDFIMKLIKDIFY